MHSNLVQNERVVYWEGREYFPGALKVLEEWVRELLLHLFIIETFNSYIVRFLSSFALRVYRGALLFLFRLQMHDTLQLHLPLFLRKLRSHSIEILEALEMVLLPPKKVEALILVIAIHKVWYFLEPDWPLRLFILLVTLLRRIPKTRLYFEVTMVQALLKFLTLVSHIHHLLGALVLGIVLRGALVSLIRIESLSVGRLQSYFVVEIVVCAWQTRYKILERMLAESPLVLDKKLVRGAGG